MHTERYRSPRGTWRACQNAGRVVAVGTTTVGPWRRRRRREARGREQPVHPRRVPLPGRRRAVNQLPPAQIHPPAAPGNLLRPAVAGPLLCGADQQYRFLSFGDAMLVAAARPAERMGPGVTPAHLTVTSVDGRARAGGVDARGRVHDPLFHAGRHTRRGPPPRRLGPGSVGPPVVLANTYHLMLRPGVEIIEALGGLHRFTGWNGHDADRLRRLPGVLPPPQGRRRRGHIPFDLRRLGPPADAGDRGGRPAAPGRRHPDGP